MVSTRAARAVWGLGAGHPQTVAYSGPACQGDSPRAAIQGDHGERIEGVVYCFANHLEAVQGLDCSENMGGPRPLPTPRVHELAVAAPREQGLEEERLRCARDESGAKFTEDRGIKPRIRQLQA